jgi:Ca-activated chloride channel family protein
MGSSVVHRVRCLTSLALALSVLSSSCAKREAPSASQTAEQATAPSPTAAPRGPEESGHGRRDQPAASAAAAPVATADGDLGGLGRKPSIGTGGAPRMKAGEANPYRADLDKADDRNGPGRGEAEKKVAVAQGTAAVAAPPTKEPAPIQAAKESAINPNGRFATTYRPGGGHLAAFESAVARGILPKEDGELVSDVGARYSPSMAAPDNKALTVATDLERGKLPPSGGEFHSRIALRSSAKVATERPHLSVHLVLDVSGSMAGESITNARKAAAALVDKLAPSDDFSLITFSSEAEVKIQDGPVGARRDQIKQTIAAIKEGGGTNIGAGLQLGYEQAQKAGIPKDAVRVVMLLSDGHVNSGILDGRKLSDLALGAFQNGVQTSAFGLGGDYDGPLMSAIASEGAGGYYYLRDSEQIAPALTTEVDRRLDPVATAVEVRIRLKKGVELLRVYGSERLTETESARVRLQEVAADKQAEIRDGIKKDRADDQQGGMRFFLPAFARDDSHSLLLKLRVPAGVGSQPLALVELKYKDRITKKNVSEEFPVAYEYANSDADSFATLNGSVARTVQGFLAGEALAEAGHLIELGEREKAVARLQEREDILRNAAQQLNEPLFLRDADRLARLRAHAAPTGGIAEPLVLAMLLETAGRVHLH